MSVIETFCGYIESTHDTLLVFEACRRGLLPRICRRLQEKERSIIKSGSIFVFDERESSMKRWTDGHIWSPSRILGNFLIYRELDKRNNSKKDASFIDHTIYPDTPNEEPTVEQSRERALVGSLTDSYRFKKNGLIKKTMSIVVNGASQHLVSYYSKEDVLGGKLRTPSSVPELACLDISPDFLTEQNFRIPPSVERPSDQMSVNSSPRSSETFRNSMPPMNGGGYSPGIDHHIRSTYESSETSSAGVYPKTYHSPSQSTPHSRSHHSMTSFSGINYHHQYDYSQANLVQTNENSDDVKSTHHSQSYNSYHMSKNAKYQPVSEVNESFNISTAIFPIPRYPHQNNPSVVANTQSPSQQRHSSQQRQSFPQRQYSVPQKLGLPSNQYYDESSTYIGSRSDLSNSTSGSVDWPYSPQQQHVQDRWRDVQNSTVHASHNSFYNEK